MKLLRQIAIDFTTLHSNDSVFLLFFQLTVQGTGWVSLALTYRGSMIGSDIIIGWVDANRKATIIVGYNSNF